MRRVFVADTLVPGQSLVVDGQTGHHFARVLRLEVGETLVVAGTNGPHDAVAVSVDSKRGTATLEIGGGTPRRDPIVRVLIVQGMAKGDKVDEVIQRTTELGVWGVWITAMERTVGRLTADRASAKVVRWQRIAEEAASQSQRDIVPQVAYYSAAPGLQTVLAEVSPHRVLLLDERETKRGIRQALKSSTSNWRELPGPVVLVVGPEGGFSDAERSWWVDTFRAESVTLGGRILRTETAGLVAATAVFCESGELGG
ncbi:RsmE family RNA methyltransferase [Alicyclobacillus sp. ALC3]|uniref:RsmE family RNA methyltransferase n=1 Tax=Alicyclobacillus sp. ALC3 TaxID=2796143 RepID=UPI0023796CDF|nr:RsmE family RNA methyltransferase [Alicyclobacillus sp. ALC3]WDL96332.1 16S rRNA (uracil(1498)-N(3))-methyltransferase [Alicyclobacillus sp. ALC3]